jgi:hypothetical protein
MAKLGIMGVAIVALLAGCISSPSSSVSSVGTAATHAGAAPFAVEMKRCHEGGGVSLYNMQDGQSGPTKDFKVADVQDDVGDPVVGSYGVPIPPGGKTTGIWHVSVVCDSYALNGVEQSGPLDWGWVGMKIQPPAWDHSGIQRQFFVADLSLKDKGLVQDLRDERGIHASLSQDVKVEWIAPQVFHQLLDDQDHGVFESRAAMKDYRAFKPGTTRFWMLIPIGMKGMDMGHDESGEMEDAPGTQYRAVAFDLVDSGSGTQMVAQATGLLTHTRTNEHAIVAGQPNGAAGNLAEVLYDGFDRALTLSASSPDGMVFNETWKH